MAAPSQITQSDSNIRLLGRSLKEQERPQRLILRLASAQPLIKNITHRLLGFSAWCGPVLVLCGGQISGSICFRKKMIVKS